MSNKSREVHHEWLYKASEDELSIRAILKEDGAPSTACFLSQQLAEKCLKALLIYHKIKFPKVHDLLALETMLIKSESAINIVHNDLALLNRYYIETRYPGDYPTFTLEEAKTAFEKALNIKKFVFEKIPF